MSRKSGIVIPNRLAWHQRLLIAVLSLMARLLIWSWRWRLPPVDPPTPGPVIFCIWHNRLSVALGSWNKYAKFKWPAQGVAALISASKDGAFLAEILSRFGMQSIRGSSSRRGPQALLEATTWLEKDHNVAITPDGPRGPCYKIHPGIIQLAQVTGRPIIPLGYHIHRRIRFNSWDGFQVPLPFSRCELRIGDPIYVPRDASDNQREDLREQLARAMMAMTRD